MDIIVKLFGLGIIVIAAGMILEQCNRKELALAVNLLGVALALALVIPEVSDLFRSVTTMFNFR